MNSIRKQAVLVGVLFIIAAIAAVIGLAAYAPIINNPDYLTTGPTEGIKSSWGRSSKCLRRLP